MNDRLNQLALFVRTVETGSFSKAAKEFGLTQPTVSRVIASLERRLGVELLRRTTRRLSMTDAGEILLGRAKEALAAIDEAENAARGGDFLSGLLRIALPTAYGVRQIVPHLEGFTALHPSLRIELMMSDRYEDLVAEGADLALRLGSQPNSSFLTRKLSSTERVIVAAPAYLDRRGTPKTIADLVNHDCLGGPADSDQEAWAFERNTTIEQVSVNIRIRTESGVGLIACAAAGLGIAIASRWMCQAELDDGRLIRILTDYTLPSMEAFVVFPSNRTVSHKARAFSDYLIDAFRGEPGRDALER